MTASSISSSCWVLSGGVFWRFISPCVRNTGGSPTRRCRSDDAELTSALSSSPSARSAAVYCGAAKSTGRPAGGAAAMAEGEGGAGAGAGGPATAGARWAAGAGPPATAPEVRWRSEERRVGKEGRSRWAAEDEERKGKSVE